MATLNADSYFHIGKSHIGTGVPCQDYALSCVREGCSASLKTTAFGVISDGCSSGRYTDVGARVMAFSVLSDFNSCKDCFLDSPGFLEQLNRGSFKEGKVFGCGDLGLLYEDMLATCLYVVLEKDGGFVKVFGDGVVALKYKDGSFDMFRFEWPSNTPFYPVYVKSGLNRFVDFHGGDLDALVFERKDWFRDKDGALHEKGVKKYSISEGIGGIKVEISDKDIEEKGLEFVAVFSDGITQIDGIDWKDAVVDFMSFKNTKGFFFKRRAMRAIRNYQKKGRGPLDDFAGSVVFLKKGG